MHALELGLEGGAARTEDKKSEPCATITYEAKNVLPANAEAAGMEPPMVVGTETNMDPKFKQLGLDFTGIWWMKDNPVPEELVSFAGSTVNSSTYPALVAMPNSRKGMWSWVDDAAGWALVKFYSGFDPEAPAHVDFHNHEYGEIQTFLTDMPLIWVDRWPFIYLNDDEWLRPSEFKPGSILPQTNYTLTRIIMGDGSPNQKYWPKFLEHMKSNPWFGQPEVGAKRMISMTSDSSCQRQCEILLPCSVCRAVC